MCDENSYSWFHSYSQQASIRNSLSESEMVSCGVPKGSILGPLFLLIFINELPLSLETSVTSVDLYADDMTIYAV